MLGVELPDLSQKPSLSYKFGAERKVLTARGRWFESADEYITHRVASSASAQIEPEDVQELSHWMSQLSHADQPAVTQMSYEELVQTYQKKARKTPRSKVLRQLYAKYGVMIPEMEGIIRVCANCDVVESSTRFKSCARCESVSYCSKECQKAHWKAHKPLCTSKWSGPAEQSNAFAVRSEVERRNEMRDEQLELRYRKLRNAMGTLEGDWWSEETMAAQLAKQGLNEVECSYFMDALRRERDG